MKKYLIIIAVITALTAAGCTADNGLNEQSQTSETTDSPKVNAEYHKIAQDDAKEMIDEGGVVVIDVREDYEYDEGHIDGAVLSPLGNLENDIVNHVSSKDDVILIYCRSGNRSQTASNILVDLGYTNVYDFGGIINWKYDIVY